MRAVHGIMVWSIFPATSLETRHADIWQQLNQQHQQSHPLLDLKFIGPLLRHFGHPSVRLAVETVNGGAASVALCDRSRLGAWQLFLPSQAQIAPAILRRPADLRDAGPDFAAWFASLPGFPLVIGLPNQDPAYSGATDAPSGRTEILPYATTIGVALDGGFDAYWQSRDRTLRDNIAKRLRKLNRDGFAPRLVVRTARTEMAAAVAAHGEMESAGWKGKKGTAISRDNLQGRFYTDVMERYAAVGLARAYQLYFNNALAASRLTIEQNGMMVVLKTAYRESFSQYSPGRMNVHFMLQELFAERRLRVVEFYTNASHETARWATFSRAIVHVNIYRSTLARRAVAALRRLHHRAAPNVPMDGGPTAKTA